MASRRVIVIFCDVSSAFSSAAAPAEPCTATEVPCVTNGRCQLALGSGRGPIAFTNGRALLTKLMTSPTIGSGTMPRLSDVFWCAAARW